METKEIKNILEVGMNGNTLAKMRLIEDIKQEKRTLEYALSNIKSNINRCLKDIKEVQKREASGQWALFGMKDKKYFCHGVFDIDSNNISDAIMSETVMILPLPDHETLTEFDGF